MTESIAAIIVNYNTADFTVACVESVQTLVPSPSILVVDNASRAEDRAHLGANLPERARVLQLACNFGFAIANNAGVAALLPEEPMWLLFLNSDTELCIGAI